VTQLKRRELEEFLASQHPSDSLQFVIGLFAEWAEREYQKSSGEFSKDDAMRKYLWALRDRLDTELSRRPSEGSARNKRGPVSIPFHYREKRKFETVAAMEHIPPDEALAFLAEVTAAWSFSMPKESIQLIPVAYRGDTDADAADAIYEWFYRYFDMWH